MTARGSALTLKRSVGLGCLGRRHHLTSSGSTSRSCKSSASAWPLQHTYQIDRATSAAECGTLGPLTEASKAPKWPYGRRRGTELKLAALGSPSVIDGPAPNVTCRAACELVRLRTRRTRAVADRDEREQD